MTKRQVTGIMNTSLYLSQSYQDAWADYTRSVRLSTFPVWDYVILTASNEHQARAFRLQIEARREFLSDRTHFAVIPDEGGVRVGSGGATLSVLRYLREKEEKFDGLRILVIHSGGDSRRVPQYSALGKLFSPVPRRLPDGRSSTLFDELMIAMSSVPGQIREGMLLLSGDVLLIFNPLLIDYSGRGAAAISFKQTAETGKDHGVFLRSNDGYVRAFFHKQSVEKLKVEGAVNDRDEVDIDTGAIILGVDILDALWGLISDGLVFNPGKYRRFVNDKVRLNLYGDFQYPLAADSTLEQYRKETPEGEYSEELEICREELWRVLRPFRMKLLRLAPAKFLHFGTTKEILRLVTSEVADYSELGWSKRVNCAMDRASGYNSVLSPLAVIGEGCYLETAYVHGGARVGKGCILSYIDIHDETVPDGVVLHGLKQANGSFVCRIYGTEDNPKESRLFGRELIGDLWEKGVPHTLWNANIYQEKKTVRAAVAAALELYRKMMSGEPLDCGKSMAAGFNDADPEAILAWNKRMGDMVRMNHIAALIENGIPASSLPSLPPLTELQKEWMERKIAGAEYGEQMRLQYYVGMALGDEKEISGAFSDLSSAILSSMRGSLQMNRVTRIVKDEAEVRLPLRVNWGGGWSDTPPYCNENGGTVLNAAILLNGERPVRAYLRRLEEKKIVFESRDMDTYKEFTELSELQTVGDPFDPFALQKGVLLACGVLPFHDGRLDDILERLGGGIWIGTEVAGVPKGSGLGTSSILAAACVKALFDFLGISCTESDLYGYVLCMEQLMSTGGGWQDQVGGVTDGIKYISSRPGLVQKLKVDQVKLDEEIWEELNGRFALIYTGQRRLARNLLRDVVGRYIGGEPDTIFALNEIQRKAALMRFELERGHVDAFAGLMTEHWELSKRIDAGSTNTLIDQIFDAVDDLVIGKMVCGAGGGGFLQVVLRREVTKEQLQCRLKEVFSDTDINVWDCTLV